MLFNSYIFILGFLPIVLGVYWLLALLGARRLMLGWLALASLAFYGYWNLNHVVLLIGSIVGNYVAGMAVGGSLRQSTRRLILIAAIAGDLVLLAYFKYTGFALDALNHVLGAELPIPNILLPLAISFFTFHQIMYLIDSYKGYAKGVSLIEFSLFVSFFPQLIAGPIVRCSEMIPQYQRGRMYRSVPSNLAIGVTIFALGLFKKVILADGVAPYADSAFMAATAPSARIDFFQAWTGVLAYTLQLYFDFSGYSDMAIGLARMFGIILPVNFNSPYKAADIIDFWRRWHMTLSRFLRDYLYIPLGGNRMGGFRQSLNIVITMLLGGLWHGANWTFVVWGGLHGLYLLINHAWRAFTKKTGLSDRSNVTSRIVARAITFLAVVVAWVFFRADSFPAAIAMLAGMAGNNGAMLAPAQLTLLGPFGNLVEVLGVTVSPFPTIRLSAIPWIAGLLIVVWLFPNTNEWCARASRRGRQASKSVTPRLEGLTTWRPSPAYAVLLGVMFAISFAAISSSTQFLYFQF